MGLTEAMSSALSTGVQHAGSGHPRIKISIEWCHCIASSHIQAKKGKENTSYFVCFGFTDTSVMKLALIVVDMQGAFQKMSRAIVENVVNIMHECHRKNIPIFITQHHDADPSSVLSKWWGTPIVKGSDRWKLIPEIEAAADCERDTFITDKVTYDAFHNTDLKKQLLELGVDTVVVCGAMTNLCCETTARSAFVNNFNVIFLQDGNATSTQEYQEATLKNLEFGFATIKSCKDFIGSLD